MTSLRKKIKNYWVFIKHTSNSGQSLLSISLQKPRNKFKIVIKFSSNRNMLALLLHTKMNSPKSRVVVLLVQVQTLKMMYQLSITMNRSNMQSPIQMKSWWRLTKWKMKYSILIQMPFNSWNLKVTTLLTWTKQLWVREEVVTDQLLVHSH